MDGGATFYLARVVLAVAEGGLANRSDILHRVVRQSEFTAIHQAQVYGENVTLPGLGLEVEFVNTQTVPANILKLVPTP